ncbi:hypothetical protein FQR65_LT20248 [Abscondita terminalis]|nr:hypothetical protein FQR65_LT20248 [Abscondita terminalis]
MCWVKARSHRPDSKEERPANKSAALTTFISLRGSLPGADAEQPARGGISRTYREGDDRTETKESRWPSLEACRTGIGLIVRTAGVGKISRSAAVDLKLPSEALEAIRKPLKAAPARSMIHQESKSSRVPSVEVRLPSGRSIVIDSTEALTAIDINSARATRAAISKETRSTPTSKAAEKLLASCGLRDLVA